MENILNITGTFLFVVRLSDGMSEPEKTFSYPELEIQTHFLNKPQDGEKLPCRVEYSKSGNVFTLNDRDSNIMMNFNLAGN